MKKKYLIGVVAGMMMLGFQGTASASTIIESGDAGSSLATAQILPGGTDVVTGSLSSGDTVDMFAFGWGGGGFYVSTVGTAFDSQLFLFDNTGLGIQANDDGIASAGPAYLQLASLAAGTYYLGVSQYNIDPYDVNGALMFQSHPYENLYGPLTSAPLGSWGTGSPQGGSYSITFASITDTGVIIDPNPTTDPNAPVPEPATMLLFGAGLAGLAGSKMRRKKA